MSTTATGITEEDQQLCDETDCAEMYRKLPKKTSPGPDGIPYEAFIHAGRDLIDSTVRMFNTIWKTETIPKQWSKSYIKVIYKGKGANKIYKTTEVYFSVTYHVQESQLKQGLADRTAKTVVSVAI